MGTSGLPDTYVHPGPEGDKQSLNLIINYVPWPRLPVNTSDK